MNTFDEIEKIEKNYDDVENMRIYSIFEHYNNVPNIENNDFTIIGLRTELSTYNKKGSKLSSKYTLDGVLYVEKLFIYESFGVWIKINWYKNDGSIGLSKTLYKSLDPTEMKKINSSNRDRLIYTVYNDAVVTLNPNDLLTIINHYNPLIENYIKYNFTDLYNAITNEPVLIDGNANNIYTLLQLTLPISAEFPSGTTLQNFILTRIS